MSGERCGSSPARWLAVALAVAGIGKAVLDAQVPPHGTDMLLVREWAAVWLVKGASPYDVRPETNYAPHAIVLLAPLALVSGSTAAVAWGGINAVLAPLVGWTGYSLAWPRATAGSRIVPVALFCLWGGLLLGIKNGQFSLLALALGFAAVRLARVRPVLAGALLGLSTVKPHVSVGFVLWAFLTGRWRLLAVAAATVGALLAAYCGRLGVDPGAAFVDWGGALWRFSGPSFVPGDLELRPLLHASIGRSGPADLVNGVAVAALLACVCLAARRLRAGRGEEVLALAAVWSLVAFFHNDYDTILALPAAAVLWHPAGAPHPAPGRDRAAWIALQAALIVDLPTLWRRLVASGLTRSGGAAGAILPHVDRVVVLVLLVYLLWRAGAGRRRPAPVRAAMLDEPFG